MLQRNCYKLVTKFFILKKLLQLRICVCIQNTTIMKKETSISASLGLTHEDMAMLLGISRSLYTLFEQGKRQLPTAALLKLSELHCDMPSDASKMLKPKAQEQTRTAFEKLLGDNEYALALLERQIAVAEKKERANANLMHFSKLLEDRKHSKSGSLAVDCITAKASRASKAQVSTDLILLQHRKEILEFEKKLLESKLKK